MFGPKVNTTAAPLSFNSTIVGDYFLGKTLGEGSCAVVKLGTHKTTGQKVAVKLIKPNSLQEQKEVIREVESLQVLKGSHPHIIKLVQLIKDNGFTCLILELGEGGELFNYIVDNGRLDEVEARRLFRQIISGMLYSHAHLVVHRDLKPENIILDAQCNVKVTDFGLSNILKPGMLFSTFCGSPVYTSPEVVLHRQYNGSIADVWSLGAVLYVMVTGGMPWRLEKNAVKNMDQLLAAKFRLPDSLGLSEEVKDLIRKMLTADARERATLEQVASHPWMCIGHDAPPKAYLKAKPLVAADRINENVLEHLILLGMDVEKARIDITKDPHCPALTAYHNLLEKHVRSCRVATDYITSSAANMSDSPSSSPTRSRAKSAPSGVATARAPVLDKILMLRGSDPLLCRSASPTERTRMAGCAPLSLSGNFADMPGWAVHSSVDGVSVASSARAQPSSARVPRRSAELRDLFSAPSMPSTDSMGLRSDLLPNIPYADAPVASPCYNPFSDVTVRAPAPASLTGPSTNESNVTADSLPAVAPRAAASDRVSVEMSPFNLPEDPPTPRSAQMLSQQPNSQCPLSPTQKALLYPSRTDSPTSALTSPYIPPVTIIGQKEEQTVPTTVAPVTPAAVSRAPVVGSPALPQQTLVLAAADSQDIPAKGLPASHVIVHAANTAPSSRKNSFRNFLDIFKRGPSKSAAPSTCHAQAQKVAVPSSPKSSRKGSALKHNISPATTRRSAKN